MWCKRRHKVVVEIIRPFFKLYFRLKYNLKIKTNPAFKDGALIISNHVNSLDPFIVGSCFKGPIYYMASIDLFEHFFVGKLIKFLVNPIPKEKSRKSDLAAVKNCIRVSKEKGSICIFPEGNRNYNGRLGYIDPSIVKLVKALKKPLVIMNIKGGFGSEPRWSKKSRKGKMEVNIKRIIEYDDYINLENDDLYNIIKEELTIDDYNYYQTFKSKNKAEYLERVLYICPACGKFHTIYSRKNNVYCNQCGLVASYNEDLTISFNKEISFKNLADWYDYQIEIIKNKEIIANQLIYSDKIRLVKPRLFKSKKKIGDGVLYMYDDRFECKLKKQTLVFEFSNIEAVTTLGKKKINFYYNGETYQMFGDKKLNFIKYLHMFYIIKNKKENKNNEFIGI